jgi:hypothetical protein
MSNSRFVFFADFLGTKNRYSSPHLVLRSRQLLEQSIDLYFVPYLEKFDMYLYEFSDTLIVTCNNLEFLLEPISKLFNRFLDFQEDNINSQINLWLRAAISYGEIMESSRFHNDKRIRTIPFLDTSLPYVYELESIRPGGRIFLDPKISVSNFGNYQKYFIKWQQITGRGKHIADVGEFLWPASIQSDNDRLAKKTMELNIRWINCLREKHWTKVEYNDSLIHLDETLKLFIRTCSVFCNKNQKNDVLFTPLPKDEDSVVDFQYEWGSWFQALKGIIENNDISDSGNLKIISSFKIIKNILKKNFYFQNFLGELDYPDYNLFKQKFYQIGLDKI